MRTQEIEFSADRGIGESRQAIVVAEIGQNHNGSVELAEQLVDAAAFAGVDAVKFVKRDLESELRLEARRRPYFSQHAFGATYEEHRRALELSMEDHARLSARARSHGLLYFSTACDIVSARQLESLDVDAFKVASRDLTNLPLVEHLALSGRPVLLSTGMSSLEEIDAAVRVLRRWATPFVVMQCTSLYPTPYDEAHLRSIETLARRFETLVGFSDHTPGVLLPPVAVALGAQVIEKHLTLDRTMKGTDHACSLEPEEFRQMVANIRTVEMAMGSAAKPVSPGVSPVRVKLGRSLVSRVSLRAGARLDESMLALKCPGDGLSWLERGLIVGRRLRRDIAADEKLLVEHFV